MLLAINDRSPVHHTQWTQEACYQYVWYVYVCTVEMDSRLT